MGLETKTVRSKGRPKKYFDTSKVYEWVDEAAFQAAKREYKNWEDAFNECKGLTKSEYESISRKLCSAPKFVNFPFSIKY